MWCGNLYVLAGTGPSQALSDKLIGQGNHPARAGTRNYPSDHNDQHVRPVHYRDSCYGLAHYQLAAFCGLPVLDFDLTGDGAKPSKKNEKNMDLTCKDKLQSISQVDQASHVVYFWFISNYFI
jgi:hypothetical protein